MVKKKLLLTLAIGSLTLAGVAGVASTALNRTTFFTNASEGLTVTIDKFTEEEGKYYIDAYNEGNRLEVAHEGATFDGAIKLADGNIYNVDAFQAITSITVFASENTDLKLSYGFYANSYVSVNHAVTSETKIDTSAVLPTHFKLSTATTATIESIVVEYNCDSKTAYTSPLLEEWHMVGEGSFLGEHDSTWTPGSGPKLKVNTDKPNEEVYIENVALKAGDKVKFTKGITWDGYENQWKTQWGAAADPTVGKIVIDENGNGVIQEDGEYSFYVAYAGKDQGIWNVFKEVAAPSEGLVEGLKLYLQPSSNWKESNARFAIYFFGTGDAWVSMTSVGNGIYEGTVPAGDWTNLIFCRMNPSAAANNWNNKWNQTSDLTYDNINNMYTVKEGTWDKGGGTWSVYGA